MTTDVTRTCQEPADFTAAGLVAALEHAWNAIRDRHPDVPAAVIVVASGSTARHHLVLGHFADGRWQHGRNRLPEVLVSGEGLRRPVADVLTTLLHEAVHGTAAARGIKDTSRQGRWHNRRFAALAAELGLVATHDPTLGWSPCTMRPSTVEDYAPVLDRLTVALSAFRHPEQAGATSGRTSHNNPVTCECACPRRVRAARSVLDLGPITCGVCGTDFRPDHESDGPT